MQISAQELIMRYLDVYAKEWPEEVRTEERDRLAREIQELYQTKLAQGVHELKAIEDVLNELGDPQELAAKEAGRNKGLLRGIYYKSFVHSACYSLGYNFYLIIAIAFAVALNSGMENGLPENTILLKQTIYASITFIVYLVMDKTQIPIKGQMDCVI